MKTWITGSGPVVTMVREARLKRPVGSALNVGAVAHGTRAMARAARNFGPAHGLSGLGAPQARGRMG